MRGALLTALGVFFLGIGAVGALVPVLPTTPFFLLAAGCFGGGNPRLYRWLAGTRYFGAFLENYRNGGGVEKRVKRRALVVLWAGLALSVALTRNLPLGLVLLAIGGLVSAHILLLKTKVSA